MKTILLPLFTLFTLLTFAQKAPKVLNVNSKKVNCKTSPYGSCFQIKDNKDRKAKKWQIYPGEIRGLDYEEGYLYTITVKKIMHEMPPADGINFYYKLIRVLSKKEIKPSAKALQGKINKEKYVLYEYLNADTLKWIYDFKKTFIQFDLAAKRITGNDGCNGFFGKIQSIDNKKISFGPIAGTLMACGGLDGRDYIIKKLLENVDGYIVNGKDIDLLQSGTVVLRYSQEDYVRVEEDKPF